MKDIKNYLISEKYYKDINNVYNNFPEVDELVQTVIKELNKYSKTKHVEENSDVDERHEAISTFLYKFINEFEKLDKAGNEIYNIMGRICNEYHY